MEQNKFKGAAPKDAATVILLNHKLTKVLWAQRNPKLRFLGGFHSFAGGKVDPGDALVEVRNCVDAETARLIACAAREVFEEVGVLLVRNGEKLTKGQRASLHDDLIAGRFSFAEILETWGLWIDAADFFYTGFWTTPKFSPMRFKTRFYIAVCPRKQEPFAAISELQNVEFIRPGKALKLWERSKVLMAPPLLFSLQALDGKSPKDDSSDRINPKNVAQQLLTKSQKYDDAIDYIELNPRLICLPLKTDTLPPATHTNCFILGKREFVVIDAASKEPSEHAKLFRLIDAFTERGFKCRGIIVSHLHRDHFGGEMALQAHLREKFDLQVPVSAHALTAGSLKDKVNIERFIEDGEVFELKDEAGKPFELRALHTPGHARGHLCFYDEEQGFLLSMDNVIGLGSVLIASPEGNMINYLNSLERMKNLPGLNFLCGSHGAAVADAKGKIEEYIAHRLEREQKILKALEEGAGTPAEIVAKVYTDISPELWPLAEKSVEAHLEKIQVGDVTLTQSFK